MTGREWLLVAVAALGIILVYLISDAFPQYPSYFSLADRRDIFGIPNAQDVVSNLPFLIVGAAGLIQVSGWRKEAPYSSHRPYYVVCFSGFLLTAVGSAWFHWRPATETLVWDRLPMTILFMGFFASVISELIGPRAARRLLPVLLTIGIFSVFHWATTETAGRGDLRLYGLVQFLPLVLIVIMLALYRRPAGYGAMIGYLLFCYAAAKVFEHFDHEIYLAFGSVVSGHSLKHLISGSGGAFLLLWLWHRECGETGAPVAPDSGIFPIAHRADPPVQPGYSVGRK